MLLLCRRLYFCTSLLGWSLGAYILASAIFNSVLTVLFALLGSAVSLPITVLCFCTTTVVSSDFCLCLNMFVCISMRRGDSGPTQFSTLGSIHCWCYHVLAYPHSPLSTSSVFISLRHGGTLDALAAPCSLDSMLLLPLPCAPSHSVHGTS